MSAALLLWAALAALAASAGPLPAPAPAPAPAPPPSLASPPRPPPTLRQSRPALVDVAALQPGVRLDIRYASAANLAGRPLYPVARCLLRPEVAAMLRRAAAFLQRDAPGLRLLLLDCYRPHRAQRALFAAVRGGPGERYVSNPDGRTGSVHSYGAAVDVTLCDASGRPLDMGTDYDALEPLAEPRHEAAARAAGTLSARALGHRQRLRAALVRGGGFLPVSNEWWHFDALRGAALRRRFGRLDVPLTDP